MAYNSTHPRIQRAATVIRSGGVVAYPTEAVWGLGCDPFDEDAVARILSLKQREFGMGLILIAASSQQLSPFLAGLSAGQRAELEASWPGPNTWLVPDNGSAPEWITGGRPTLALRVTDHPVASALCMAVGGPVVSTSANPHGLPAARTSLKVHSYFPQALDDILPGNVGSYDNPSTIRDLISGRIIRGS